MPRPVTTGSLIISPNYAAKNWVFHLKLPILYFTFYLLHNTTLKPFIGLVQLPQYESLSALSSSILTIQPLNLLASQILHIKSSSTKFSIPPWMTLTCGSLSFPNLPLLPVFSSNYNIKHNLMILHSALFRESPSLMLWKLSAYGHHSLILLSVNSQPLKKSFVKYYLRIIPAKLFDSDAALIIPICLRFLEVE